MSLDKSLLSQFLSTPAIEQSIALIDSFEGHSRESFQVLLNQYFQVHFKLQNLHQQQLEEEIEQLSLIEII